MYAKKHKSGQSSPDYTLGIAVGAIHARIQDSLDAVSRESGGTISRSQLAFGLAELLRASAGGELLDRTERLSTLRRQTAQGDEVRPGKTPVHVRPRRKPTSKLTARGEDRRTAMAKAVSKSWTTARRKQLGKAVRAYWAGKTQAERSAEMTRRRAVADAKKAAKAA
jgi:hypothetical protein